jgi:uncharacterized membrane protein
VTQNEYAASHKIVAFIFADRGRAATVNDELQAKGLYEAQSAIASTVVEVDDKGKTHVHEHGRGVKGSAIGMAVGGALGLLGGPAGVLLLAVAGAAIGGMAGKLGGRPIPTEDLGKLEAQLQPNTSAVLILVENAQVDPLITAMASYGAQVVTLSISEELSGEIFEAAALPGKNAGATGATTGSSTLASALPGHKAHHASAAGSSSAPQATTGEKAGPPA